MSISSTGRDDPISTTRSDIENCEDSRDVMLKDVLWTLPIELRFKVYAHLIAAGEMAITRASAYTYEESKALVSTHGMYRINLGFVDGVEGAAVAPRMSASIQHVEICAKLSFRSNLLGTATLPMFDLLPIKFLQGRSIIRKTCRITLTLDHRFQAYVWWPRAGLHLALQEFNGFINLVVRLEYERMDKLLARPGITPFTLDGWRNIEYAMIQRALRPYLGPSVHNRSGEDHGLTFSPSVFERSDESG